MGRERASFRLEDACWRTGSDGVDRQPDHGGSIAHLTESVQVWDDAELGPNLIPKVTDEIVAFQSSALPDQRNEKSHLPLFSYDILSAGQPEKGWLWLPDPSLSKPVCLFFFKSVFWGRGTLPFLRVLNAQFWLPQKNVTLTKNLPSVSLGVFLNPSTYTRREADGPFGCDEGPTRTSAASCEKKHHRNVVRGPTDVPESP